MNKLEEAKQISEAKKIKNKTSTTYNIVKMWTTATFVCVIIQVILWIVFAFLPNKIAPEIPLGTIITAAGGIGVAYVGGEKAINSISRLKEPKKFDENKI